MRVCKGVRVSGSQTAREAERKDTTVSMSGEGKTPEVKCRAPHLDLLSVELIDCIHGRPHPRSCLVHKLVQHLPEYKDG